MSSPKLDGLKRYVQTHPLRSAIWLALLTAFPFTVVARAERYGMRPWVFLAVFLLVPPVLAVLTGFARGLTLIDESSGKRGAARTGPEPTPAAPAPESPPPPEPAA